MGGVSTIDFQLSVVHKTGIGLVRDRQFSRARCPETDAAFPFSAMRREPDCALGGKIVVASLQDTIK
jgi:hypothetical protein